MTEFLMILAAAALLLAIILNLPWVGGIALSLVAIILVLSEEERERF